MSVVKIHEAKTHLSRLVDEAVRGGDVVIALEASLGKLEVPGDCGGVRRGAARGHPHPGAGGSAPSTRHPAVREPEVPRPPSSTKPLRTA